MSSFVEFENAYKVVKKLRDPNGGCPWDLEQTHKSLAQFAVEEAYELSHAIEEGDPKAIESELGDLLLQVLLHGTIGEENKHFDIESISKALSDKIIGRHPHVFGEDAEKISYEEVKDRWEKMKQEEKASASKGSFYISQEDAFCPSLMAAHKIGRKTSKVHFDWETADQVLYKVEEEWQEVKEEIAPGIVPNKEKVEEEIGDLLFSVAQLARHLDLSAEECLKKANLKFIKRFQHMELALKNKGESLEDQNQEIMEALWQDAKRD